VVTLQACIVGVLALISRQRRQRPQGFPHHDIAEIQVGDNQLKLYSFGQELYDAMFQEIDAARESIYLESYIWKADAVGEKFKEHLIRKARAGVEVYVIFDGVGNLVVPHEFKQFPHAIHTLEYQPFQRPWHLINPRRYALEHRKVLVVDGHTGFVGGYNLGSLYATEWRDTHIRVRGPGAAQLAQMFVSFWNEHLPRNMISRHYTRLFDAHFVVQGNDALRLSFPIRDMYISAIDRAEHHIYLTNAYFIPDHILLEALTSAARRGVDVQILLPWRSNHVVADWLARNYFATCLEAGIRVFGYNTMIHAKTCTIDGAWTTIGTANLDRLSSLGNYEVNVEIYSPELAATMERLFLADKAYAREFTLERWQRRPIQAKISERVLAPLRFFL
jgi:cardiolipin synthase